MRFYPKYRFNEPDGFHSRILLCFLCLSSLFFGGFTYFFAFGALFDAWLTWAGWVLFAVFLTIVIGSYYLEPLKKQIDNLAFAGSLIFNFYLTFCLYETQLDFYLMRYAWIFAAFSCICFSKHWHVILLSLANYVTISAVHLLLPPEVIYYPVRSYLLLTPPLAIIFIILVSRGMVNHKKLLEKELSLRRKTEELDTILNTLNAMVAYKDHNNVFKKVNRAMAQFLGMTKAEIEGVSLYDLFDFDTAKQFHKEDKQVMSTGEPILNLIESVTHPITKEVLWLRTSKSPYIDEQGAIAGVVLSTENVTEQVNAATKLRESEERFRMIFENAPDGMALVEHPSWQFMRVNHAFCEMLGYEENEILQVNPFDLVHPDDHPQCRQLFEDITQCNASQFSSEKRYIHKTGRIVHCILSICVVKENGEPKHLITSVKDITQQKENDSRLKLYARQLEESNRNLQEFAYAASHDLREPLRTVVSYVQLLQLKLPPAQMDTNTSEFMEFVVGGAKRMENQIQALLDYSRAGKGDLNLTAFDFKDAVENVCLGLHKQMVENNAIVEIGDLPKIVADRLQVETVLQNLISNAIKYRSPERAPHIFITARENNSSWQISVSDNGIGIEEEYLEKIFAVFRRLHHPVDIPGTGVGLAICRRIIQRHGGKIWANSTPGVGTTFNINIPFVPEEEGNLSVVRREFLQKL